MDVNSIPDYVCSDIYKLYKLKDSFEQGALQTKLKLDNEKVKLNNLQWWAEYSILTGKKPAKDNNIEYI